MKNYLLLLALVSTVFLTSCSDDDEEVKSKTELLTASGWKLTEFTVNPAFDYDNDGTTETNLLPFVPACSQDDLTIYNADKTYAEDEGGSKCDTNDPQVFETGTWTFNGDETTLTKTKTNSTTAESFTITELTENSFKYTETVTDPNDNITYTFSSTFSH